MIPSDQILDAAEQLLRVGKAEFSMRELATEAAVSFATPFNRFGSKAAVIQALSARRIAQMSERFALAEKSHTAASRVLLAFDIASDVMLSDPSVNRAVMGAISAPTNTPGSTFSMSQGLWASALGAGEGFAAATRKVGLSVLPWQLAIAFRGSLSFWTAGEFVDSELRDRSRMAAASAMFGFVDRSERAALLILMGEK